MAKFFVRLKTIKLKKPLLPEDDNDMVVVVIKSTFLASIFIFLHSLLQRSQFNPRLFLLHEKLTPTDPCINVGAPPSTDAGPSVSHSCEVRAQIEICGNSDWLRLYHPRAQCQQGLPTYKHKLIVHQYVICKAPPSTFAEPNLN